MNISASELNEVNAIIAKAQKEVEKVTPFISVEIKLKSINKSEISDVINHIYQRLGLPRNDKSNDTRLVWIRDIISYYLRDKGFTLMSIGQGFGGKDHSTIITSIERAKIALNENRANYQKLLIEIEHLKLIK